MDRRVFLSTAVLSLAAGGLRPQTGMARPEEAGTTPGRRRFEITTRVTLLDAPGAARLWLPLLQTAGEHQTVLDSRWRASGRAGVARDARYGAEVLAVVWDDVPGGPDTPKTVETVQVVSTRDREGGDRTSITPDERRLWLHPTESAPTDGIVRDTAERIVAGHTAPRARLRAIYDWVVDNTSRDPQTPGCGLGDVRAMLESGNLDGKCADINGLMTALARASGLPARDVYGIRLAPSRRVAALGADGVVSKAQHCRSEVYLDGEGWFPLDPADVRKAMLEHKLAPGDARTHALRDDLCGGWEMNWAGYNCATDIVLPGAAEHQKPNFPFLMYPCAFTATGQPNALDPARFRYDIVSREITA